MSKYCYYLLPVLLLAFLWLAALPACQKDDPSSGRTRPDLCPWPEITTEGKHTLGFKINGKEWVPCVDIYAIAVTLRPIDALMTESDGSNALSFVGTRSVISTGDSIINGYGFYFRPLHAGVIKVDELENCKFTFSQHGDGTSANEWNLPTSRAGFKLEISNLDLEKNIVSGTFEAILLPKYGDDTLHITDGRFDLTYYQQ